MAKFNPQSRASSNRSATSPPADIVYRHPADLIAAARNARIHTNRQLAQIAASIDRFGFTNPVLIGHDLRIVAGHGRVEAAKQLGLNAIPTLSVAHLSDAELRALALADNKIAANAGWDVEILKIELQELADLQLDFDIEVTGFSTAEIDLHIDGAAKPSKTDPADALPDIEAGAPVATRMGDVWNLGDHRLICGDSRAPETFANLMGDELARLVFSDPPYNVAVAGHVSGLGAVKHADFAMASGEMTPAAFTAFLAGVFHNLVEVSLNGALHYQCIDWRHISEMMAAGAGPYSELKNVCVWVKENGGMGSFYRSQHELVFVWKVGDAPHTNTVELGRHGRYRTNVWAYAGVNSAGPNRLAQLAMHPTCKPVAMIIDALKDASKRGEIILDPFGGSGSTLIAAHKAKRRARLVEYEPRYCDVTVRRWQALTKADAILAETGETFGDVHARRSQSAAAVAKEGGDE